ncbi:dirigent protein 22-like [Coffea arabica]|uniref:Dirigent protein n=1 Tax=Coffea arabica TaxID=13443 RepID=A0A6P6S637_COFAR|nr:dirigent protein 22-like [Coffea arabica]
MAKSSALASIQISLVLLLAIVVCLEVNLLDPYCCYRGKETKITAYVQLFLGGPNVTTVPVAGALGRPRIPEEFGTISVNDARLTEGISINSLTVGRSQGLYVSASRDNVNSFDLFSFLFTNAQYNGSTLEFQGPGLDLQNVTTVREVSVVSGTKTFRYAQGYATFQTVLRRPAMNYTVIRGIVTIRHY